MTVTEGTTEESSPATSEDTNDIWELRLYIAGQTPRSIAAQANLRKFCQQYLKDRYRIEIIDLLRDPRRAHLDQIIAIPTLIRCSPPPTNRIIGDLSNTKRILDWLSIPSVGTLDNG